MARVNFPRFDSVIETCMQHFFQTLREKDQRRYAAVEAERLGHGGIEYISEVLGCSTKGRAREH
jgi:hypothetical protein